MGKIERILGQCELPERDDHNSRVFVDIAENVHIHYREHRLVFSVKEFGLFAKAIVQAMPNLLKKVQLGYKESPDLKDADTEIIGGSQTENLNLVNPKASAYFDKDFVIEKQVEGYGDVIHIHYRDLRIVMRKFKTWEKFCKTVWEAWKNTKPEDFKE